MLNSSERHYDLQQIRPAFHFWRNLISKDHEWLLLMMLEWINTILTLFFGEREAEKQTQRVSIPLRGWWKVFTKILENKNIYWTEQRKKWTKVSAFKLATNNGNATVWTLRRLKLIYFYRLRYICLSVNGWSRSRPSGSLRFPAWWWADQWSTFHECTTCT